MNKKKIIWCATICNQTQDSFDYYFWQYDDETEECFKRRVIDSLTRLNRRVLYWRKV